MKNTLVTLILVLCSTLAFSQELFVRENELRWELKKVLLTPEQRDSTGQITQPATFSLVKTGRVVGTDVDLLPDTTLKTPHSRRFLVLSLLYDVNKDIALTGQIRYYNPAGDSLMIDVIDRRTDLSAEKKEYEKRRFRHFDVSKSTAGSFIDPVTMQIVPEGTPGAISESLFLQSLTLNAIKNLGAVGAGEYRIQHQMFAVEKLEVKLIIPRLGL